MPGKTYVHPLARWIEQNQRSWGWLERELAKNDVAISHETLARIGRNGDACTDALAMALARITEIPASRLTKGRTPRGPKRGHLVRRRTTDQGNGHRA